MNTDPSTNMIAIEVRGHSEPFVMSGRTRDDDCVQRAWYAVPVDHRSEARNVTRIYSEWQPSAADAAFIEQTFPAVKVTYSFDRPGPDGWDRAFAEVQRVISAQEADRAAERVAENMQHVADHGELLPVLWSRTSPKVDFLEHLPHREVVPGHLHVALATVAMTPDGRIGMQHVAHAAMGGMSFEDAWAEAAETLVKGLRVDVHHDAGRPEKGQLLVLRREGPFASSAVALPDFRRQMATALGDDRLVVGLPDPDSLLVTRADSGWIDDLRHAVLGSPCPSSEMVPSLLAFEPAGVRMLAERA